MKMYENENLVIKYSEKDEDYISLIIDTLSANSRRIINFFKLNSLSKKVNIVIWDSVEKYREQLEPQLIKHGREYKEWMIADTFDGNINMMSISAVRTTKNREDYSLEEFLETVCHEFVHICQKELSGPKLPTWVWEMLATNLGNPSFKVIVPINVSIEELNNNFNNIRNNYSIAYTIGKYLFEQYGNDYIYNLITSSDDLENQLSILFKEAKEWSESKIR